MVECARFGKIGNWLTSLEKIRTSPGDGAASLYRYEWSERPVILSEGYYSENLPESDKFEDGSPLIQDVIRGLDSMFLRDFSEVNQEYLSENGFRAHFLDRLKDPGILHHVIFWDYVKDPTAIIFEWHHYRERFDLCRGMLDGSNYDIYGRPRMVNAISGSWEQLVKLYHAQFRRQKDTAYSYKLFKEVLAWPLS